MQVKTTANTIGGVRETRFQFITNYEEL